MEKQDKRVGGKQDFSDLTAWMVATEKLAESKKFECIRDTDEAFNLNLNYVVQDGKLIAAWNASLKEGFTFRHGGLSFSKTKRDMKKIAWKAASLSQMSI